MTRKLPVDKGDVAWHQQMNMFFLWPSGTMNMSCFATGFCVGAPSPSKTSADVRAAALRPSILITIFSSILGGAATGFDATFGAPNGLRQILHIHPMAPESWSDHQPRFEP
ncbi:hypothetical protein ACEQ8H_003902 [Pleosporales sp. CAS-2024a]